MKTECEINIFFVFFLLHETMYLLEQAADEYQHFIVVFTYDEQCKSLKTRNF